jgi:aryl-alcohol dehydrogenase-like predicted oxidoreductase
MDPTATAIGTWSAGRFMRFGEEIAPERMRALLRPSDGLRTVMTADAYGQGEADRALGEALRGIERDSYCLVGAVGHDFYEGRRDGAKGFPRFTDPRLRGPADYPQYLKGATEQSLARCGSERFDLLLLHNPDRTGYQSEAVWEGMAALRDAGLTRMLGIAPGPANGFTLDLISCLERFGELIDWAMIIYGPFEPWPGELVLAAARRNDVRLITRVVDYGGVFHDDVLAEEQFPEHDHRRFRPHGWVAAAREKLDRVRPFAETHRLTPLQLACAWNLAQDPVACVAPTLIQERGPAARPIEDKRAELAAVKMPSPLGDDEVQAIRAIGDNAGSMALKGASLEHHGAAQPDRWELGEMAAVAERWGIEPQRDLAKRELTAASAATARAAGALS